jgi:hypothetical protein
MCVWSFALFIRNKESRLIQIEEIISFIFCFLIIIAYLKIVGAYRYIFPAQIVSMIFFVPALFSIVEWSKKRCQTFYKYIYTFSIVVIVFLALFGIYGLCFDSWVANYYNSRKTAYWQGYFSHESLGISYFFYDTPEIAIFDRNKNYYQFIDPGNFRPFSIKEMEVVEKGLVDRIIIRKSYQ